MTDPLAAIAAALAPLSPERRLLALARALGRAGADGAAPWPHDAAGRALTPRPEWCAP